MLFNRRKMPDGQTIPEEDRMNARLAMAEKHHFDFYQWIHGYIELLERRLHDLEDRCKKCKYRDCEGSNYGD